MQQSKTPAKTMSGMVLTGHGGLDKLAWRTDLPVPVPGADEVLIKVGAAAVNNTDINTRIGWYSKSVSGDTASAAVAQDSSAVEDDGAWNGTPLTFPRIQGADCCGTIIAVGENVSDTRLGERVLVRSMPTRPGPDGTPVVWTFGSEMNGAFAEYASITSFDAIAVDSPLSDLELATFPCAFSTAEGMIQRGRLGAEDVLITGASGGVGSAAIQLAKRRGATVTAITSASKVDAVKALGADHVLTREDAIPAQSYDVALDLVGGPAWEDVINGLRNHGRYVVSGAIAGPVVPLDLRTLYLRDLDLLGSTLQKARVFTDLVSYIEAGEIRPVIADTFDLKDLAKAQAAFMEKSHIGKIAIRVAS